MGLLDFLLGQRKDQDGSSPEKAIAVQSVADEYQWIQENCPGFMPRMQSLQEIDGKPFDVLSLQSATGEQRTVYFDISSFFGK